jgi:hypothetical protein
LPVVLYGVKQLTALGKDHKLQVFENKAFRKTFGSKKDENQVLLRHIQKPTANLQDWHTIRPDARQRTSGECKQETESTTVFWFVFRDRESQGSDIKH